MVEVLPVITDILREVLDLEADAAITPATDVAEDLGADSLDMLELIMSAESEFGVEIDEDAASRLRTVGDIVKYIEGVI